jgi:hypothetical protein
VKNLEICIWTAVGVVGYLFVAFLLGYIDNKTQQPVSRVSENNCVSYAYNIIRLDNVSAFNFNTCFAVQNTLNLSKHDFIRISSCGDCSVCMVGSDKDFYCTGTKCLERTNSGVCTPINVIDGGTQ